MECFKMFCQNINVDWIASYSPVAISVGNVRQYIIIYLKRLERKFCIFISIDGTRCFRIYIKCIVINIKQIFIIVYFISIEKYFCFSKLYILCRLVVE